MRHSLKSEAAKRKGRLTIVVLAALVAGILVTWSTAWSTSRKMRSHLLGNARIAAQTVGIGHVAALSGTAADMQSPDYLRLKNELTRVRRAVRDCRFVYLMGRKPDGTIFFYADSEPVGSKDESPAGQSYDEASVVLRGVFTLGRENTDGPMRDRWGTWLSAFVPLTGLGTASAAVVLGVDVDARDWAMAIAANSAIPAVLTIVLLIALGSTALVARHSATPCADRPVLRRLMLPLAGTLFLLVAGFSAALLWHQKSHVDELIASDIAVIPEDFSRVLDLQADTLCVALHFIADNPDMRAALKIPRSRAVVVGTSCTVQRTASGTGHYTSLLPRPGSSQSAARPQSGEVRGHHRTVHACEAQRTGRTVAGVELGPLGTFSLRVVEPVFDEEDSSAL